MKPTLPRVSVLVPILVLCLSAAVPAGEPPSRGFRPDFRGRRFGRGPQKNDAPVKAAFREIASRASAGTVRVLGDGEDVALGTVVDAGGYVVTKASLLRGKLACRLADGKEREAKTIGVSEDYDLALLKVDAGGLKPIPWRTGDPPPPGSLVAAVAPDDALLGIGVVSTEPRRIRGSTRPTPRRAWLGIGLGGGESGVAIASVERGTAAAEAGLEVGDRVKSIDGVAMKSVDQIIQTVGSHDPGDTIKLRIQRGDKELEISATLRKQPTGLAPQDHWGGGPFSERRWGFPAALPHDIAVPPDECGGPLVDTDGNVVGINIARALRVTTYAIPAQNVKQVIDELKKGKS